MRNSKRKRALKRLAPIFLFPMFAAFLVGFVWPFLQGIYLSFFRFKTLRFTEFVGFQNYKAALSDPTFLHSFIHSAFHRFVGACHKFTRFFLCVCINKGNSRLGFVPHRLLFAQSHRRNCAWLHLEAYFGRNYNAVV